MTSSGMRADVFFLPAILLLGVLSTFQDLRVRRISNLWISISLVYAITVHLYLFICGDRQETSWFLLSLVNVLVSAIVSVYFWKQNWWGGGDAKLFVCYAALISLDHYPFGYFAYYFASFLLLLITFVPAAVCTFLHAQYNLIKAGKKIDYTSPSSSKAHLLKFIQFSAGSIAVLFLFNLLALILKHYLNLVQGFTFFIWFLGIVFYNKIFLLFEKLFWLVLLTWFLGICVIVFVPFLNHVNVWHLILRSLVSWVLIFILRVHILRTIDTYVEWSKNNNMAFAGWMFLGALVIWFFKMTLWLTKLFYIK